MDSELFGSEYFLDKSDPDQGLTFFDKKIGIFLRTFLKMIQFVFDYIHISLENLLNA